MDEAESHRKKAMWTANRDEVPREETGADAKEPFKRRLPRAVPKESHGKMRIMVPHFEP
jgi:hypothetical protein